MKEDEFVFNFVFKSYGLNLWYGDINGLWHQLMVIFLIMLLIVPRSHIDDEYANATEADPKILLTTSRNPSAPLIRFTKVMFSLVSVVEDADITVWLVFFRVCFWLVICAFFDI